MQVLLPNFTINFNSTKPQTQRFSHHKKNKSTNIKQPLLKMRSVQYDYYLPKTQPKNTKLKHQNFTTTTLSGSKNLNHQLRVDLLKIDPIHSRKTDNFRKISFKKRKISSSLENQRIYENQYAKSPFLVTKKVQNSKDQPKTTSSRNKRQYLLKKKDNNLRIWSSQDPPQYRPWSPKKNFEVLQENIQFL